MPATHLSTAVQPLQRLLDHLHMVLSAFTLAFSFFVVESEAIAFTRMSSSSRRMSRDPPGLMQGSARVGHGWDTAGRRAGQPHGQQAGAHRSLTPCALVSLEVGARDARRRDRAHTQRGAHNTPQRRTCRTCRRPHSSKTRLRRTPRAGHAVHPRRAAACRRVRHRRGCAPDRLSEHHHEEVRDDRVHLCVQPCDELAGVRGI